MEIRKTTAADLDAVMEILNTSGVLDGMSETNQLSLF